MRTFCVLAERASVLVADVPAQHGPDGTQEATILFIRSYGARLHSHGMLHRKLLNAALRLLQILRLKLTRQDLSAPLKNRISRVLGHSFGQGVSISS